MGTNGTGGAARSAFHRLLLGAGLALSTAACSSPRATIESGNPDRIVETVRDLYVVVGHEAELVPEKARPDDRDPARVATGVDVERCLAWVQLEPVRDEKGRQVWKVVDRRFRSLESRVTVEFAQVRGLDGAEFTAVRPPIEIGIDEDLLEANPDTTLLVVARFRSDGGRAPAPSYFVLDPPKLRSDLSFAYDVRDGQLIQTR